MNRDARFYFANLTSDVVRCIRALTDNDPERYQQSLSQTRVTLEYLRDTKRPEAYEEGLLLIQGLKFAHERGTLAQFLLYVERLGEEYSPLTL